MNDTPTPTFADKLADQSYKATIQHAMDRIDKLNAEWAAVTEQRDGLRAGIDCASDQLSKVTEELTAAREELADFKKHIDVQNKLINTLQSKKVKFKEQRDRLAEALRGCREDSAELLGEREWWKDETRCGYIERYKETADNLRKADTALATLEPPPTL